MEPKQVQKQFKCFQLEGIAFSEKDLLEAGYEINNKLWSEKEDKLLKKLISEFELDWIQIASKMEGRTPKMCYNRYRRLQYTTKKLWKESE